MRRRIFTLGKTEVWLHPATILMALYMAVAGYGPLLAVSIASILLHEGAHATVAALFGLPPREIELTPLGAMMRLEDDEALSPWRRLLMLAAGPAMTLGLCSLALTLTRAGRIPWVWGRMLFLNNLAMLLMNLLPALPLDGGRMTALVLSSFVRRETVGTAMRAVGTALGVALVTLNLRLCWSTGGWNLSLTFAGCFLIYSAAVSTTGRAMAELRALADRKIRLEHRGALPCRWVAVTDETTLRRAVGRLHPRYPTLFCVLRAGTADCRGLLTEQALIAAYLDDPSRVVGDLPVSCRNLATFAD